MKNKILLTALALSASFSGFSSTFAADSATRPTIQQARGPANLLRCLFCCCGSDVRESTIAGLELVHGLVSTFIETAAPDHVRELYLKAMNTAYTLSTAAVASLTAAGITNPDGSIKPGWADLVRMILRQDGSAPSATAFHFAQLAEDLLQKAPTIAAELESSLSGSDFALSATAAAKLKEYGLLAEAAGDTAEQIRLIATAIQAAKAATPAHRGFAPRRTSFRVAPLEEVGTVHPHNLFAAPRK